MALLKAKAAENVANPASQSGVSPASLDSDDPMERRRAVQQCVEEPNPVAALLGLLREEHENIVRQAAFTELAALGTSEAAQGLAELLSNADPALRNGALEALVAMPEQAMGLLAPLAFCDDPDVRIFAVMMANELPSERTADWLIALAAKEQDANVCSNLAEAIGGTGRRDALPVLQAIIERFPREPYLAFAAETAMTRIREG
ncbi:hypothetical protein GTZ99_12725 [Novosphingobium sp. FSY-8]|uniref:HEAT repeat protein n=1 Tax=Novosphingobium ovatum TaxID=1908523 RepID=A0ABW9XFV2_9SPHN|nr:HEAT repeat domain-containing protein [Novosphingobium ovatum]NBC37415.1 hypothetical protein [Novosphingobium ovatum]